MIASGPSDGVVEGFALRPLEDWPPGVYAGPQPAVPMRFVVVSELPITRATLLLRLMGRGATLRAAIRELAALPPDAWERQHAAPLLIKLRIEIAEAQASGLLEEEEELMLTGQELVESIRNEGRRAGLQSTLHHLFTRKLGRPLTDDEAAALIRRLDTLGPDRLSDAAIDLEAEALVAWLAAPDAR